LDLLIWSRSLVWSSCPCPCPCLCPNPISRRSDHWSCYSTRKVRIRVHIRDRM
jgi:hypothetical protein